MKALVFDIECSGISFKANSGFLLCVGIKDLEKNSVEMYQRDNMTPDPLDDKKLVKQVYDRLCEADMWVTHNGKRFDVPYLNSRLLKWNLPPLPNIPHVDTCETSFKRLLIKNSLKAVGEYLGLHDHKYDVSMDEWVRAYAGNKKALAQIVHHCINDVKLTEKVYLRLRSLGFKHPNVGNITEKPDVCPICGKDSLIRKGWIFNVTTKSPRFMCYPSTGGCGAWSHGKAVKTTTVIRP